MKICYEAEIKDCSECVIVYLVNHCRVSPDCCIINGKLYRQLRDFNWEQVPCPIEVKESK